VFFAFKKKDICIATVLTLKSVTALYLCDRAMSLQEKTGVCEFSNSSDTAQSGFYVLTF